jgi:hypothetical protein
VAPSRHGIRSWSLGLPGTILIGAVLAAGCAVLQLLWSAPPYPSDQIHYLAVARDFPTEPAAGTLGHQYLRYGLIAPIRLAIEAFGYSQAAYYAVPFLTAVVLVLSVYALGVLWFGRLVGVLAALVTVGNSIVFPDLTMPLPDLTATAQFTAAVGVAAALRGRRPWVASNGRRRSAALALIGVLLASSYLCREFIVFLWPLIGLLLLRRVRTRELIWLAAPVLLVVLAESAVNALVVGDPLARLHTAAEHGSGTIPPKLAEGFQNLPVEVYLTRLSFVLTQAPEGRWLLILLALTLVGAVIAVTAPVARHWWPSRCPPLDPRVRHLGLLAAWIALLWVPLTLLGGLLNPSQPKLRLQMDRYWFPIFPALILGGVAVVWLAGRAVANRLPVVRTRPIAIAAVAATATAAVALPPVVIAASGWVGSPGYRVNGATHLERFRDWLADHKDVPVVWADRRTAAILPLFTTGPFGGEVADTEIRTLFGRGPKPVPGRNEHVVLYSVNSRICGHCRVVEEDLFGKPIQPPATWTKVYQTADGVLQIYRVG